MRTLDRGWTSKLLASDFFSKRTPYNVNYRSTKLARQPQYKVVNVYECCLRKRLIRNTINLCGFAQDRQLKDFIFRISSFHLRRSFINVTVGFSFVDYLDS